MKNKFNLLISLALFVLTTSNNGKRVPPPESLEREESNNYYEKIYCIPKNRDIHSKRKVQSHERIHRMEEFVACNVK